jgi:hypothetical protein
MPVGANNVSNDLFLVRKCVSHTLLVEGMPESSRPSRRHGQVSCERGERSALPLRRMGQFHRMAEELGFPRRKRGEYGRAEKGPLVRSRRANDRGVTREGLDVARYITDMTAQLEAMAIAGRLDLLAYFLGMAKAESEIYVRTNAVAEAEAEHADENSFEDAIGFPHGTNSFD